MLGAENESFRCSEASQNGRSAVGGQIIELLRRSSHRGLLAQLENLALPLLAILVDPVGSLLPSVPCYFKPP